MEATSEGEADTGFFGWSIYENTQILARYQILDRIGVGAYGDVYRGRSLATGDLVALKEIHEKKSSRRELKALKLLRGCPNVVQLLDFFWLKPGVVLVLEYLPSSLADVIEETRDKGLEDEKVKVWMRQLLTGVAWCHYSGVLHRDLKPSNLLIRADGVLKVADFGTARVLKEPEYQAVAKDEGEQEELKGPGKVLEHLNKSDDIERWLEGGKVGEESQEKKPGMHASSSYSRLNIETEVISFGTEASPRVSEDEPAMEQDDDELDEEYKDEGELTGCVGTRWYMAPEILYGSRNYDFGVDLWAVGCIFGELIQGMPLFPGTSDIDQLSRLIRVLGVPTPSTWPELSELPDYGKICFNDDRLPMTLAKLVNRASRGALELLEKFLVYRPASRMSCREALNDAYLQQAEEAAAAAAETGEDHHDKEAVEAWLRGGQLESK